MPTYEYYCAACQEPFSRRERIEEHTDSAPPCPRCGSRKVERVMSGFYARTPRKS